MTPHRYVLVLVAFYTAIMISWLSGTSLMEIDDWAVRAVAYHAVSLVCALLSYISLLLLLTRGSYHHAVLIERKTGEIAGEYETGVFFWRWDTRLKDHILVPVIVEDNWCTLHMHLSPITPNPKVRELSYQLRVVAGGSGLSVSKFRRRFGYWTDFPWARSSTVNFVRSFLYVFQEQHSRELGELYNPLDESQQERFRALLVGFLEPFLADTGISIKHVSFSV